MTQITRRALCAGAAATASLAALPRAIAAPSPAWPPAGELAYRVVRKGSEIGRHTTRIQATAGGVRVDNRIQIEVGALGFVLFRYEHSSYEVWDQDGLLEISARTNDDGKIHEISGARRGEMLQLTGDAKTTEISPLTPTTGLWHPRTPQVRELLDLDDADVTHTRPTPGESDRVRVPGEGVVACRHHHLNDPLQREVWYDHGHRLLRVRFVSRQDDSHIDAEPLRLHTGRT